MLCTSEEGEMEERRLQHIKRHFFFKKEKELLKETPLYALTISPPTTVGREIVAFKVDFFKCVIQKLLQNSE